MDKKRIAGLVALVCCSLVALAVTVQPQHVRASPQIGLFSHHGDVGKVLHPGSMEYNASKGTYTITGSGTNMWFSTDEFQFVWKKVSGDVTLTSDIAFEGNGGNPHRKAVLMIRQSLDPDSVYADVARHGVGLTSLQWREEKGGTTHEVQANISAPKRLRIEKRGDYFYMFLGEGNDLHLHAGSPLIRLEGPFYVGLGICAHDKDRVETAVFSNVDLETSKPEAIRKTALYSTLEQVAIKSGDRREVYTTPGRIEAPNWTPDGKSLLFNRDGRIEKSPLRAGSRKPLTPALPHVATTITAFRSTDSRSPSLTAPRRSTSRSFTYCRLPAEHRAASSARAPLIFTVGRRTARQSLFVASAKGSLISTLFPQRAVRKFS